MNRQTAIAKLEELASKTELTEPATPIEQPEQEELPLIQRIEAVRKHVEDISKSLGVELRPDSLAVPIPVELLTEIINRLLVLESINPPIEFIKPEENENAES